MKEGEKIILNDSPEAATYRTDIAGWVSRDGRFFGDRPGAENAARWAGRTHVICPDCGAVTERDFVRCKKCREALAEKRYLARQSRRWDGETPLYSEVVDRFFFDADELNDYCEESECTPASLRLLLCKGERLSSIDPDYWADQLPEDGELPPAVEAALRELNQAINEVGPVSWGPTEYAADLGDAS